MKLNFSLRSKYDNKNVFKIRLLNMLPIQTMRTYSTQV